LDVVWSERAMTRLREIHAYILEREPLRAQPALDRLVSRVELLRQSPRAGRRLAAFADDELREVLERPFRIIYRLSYSRIEILTVKHYRQRLAERPQEW
jgi:toxin ParE1/3/4